MTTIERLRALEKKWRDEVAVLRDMEGSCDHEGAIAVRAAAAQSEGYAYQLASLIAELGQEVGAGKCEECGGFGEVCLAGRSAHPSNWHRCEACCQSSATSTSHTSEARDWEGVEHVASHIENAVEYITKQYPNATMLDRAPIMRNMRRWARNLRAAMRQEAE